MNSQSGGTEGNNGGENQQVHSLTPNTQNDVTAGKPSSDSTGHPKDEAYWERKQFKVQRLIACAGILGLAIYGFQLWEMQKATKAATDGLSLTRQMARIDQRAWVDVQSLDGEPTVGSPLIIRVGFKNTGKTFAQSFVMQPLIETADRGARIDDVDLRAEAELTKPNISKGTIAPGAGKEAIVLVTEFQNGMTQEQFDALKFGKRRLVVFGKITYEDVFGCQHWTTYSYTLSYNPPNFPDAVTARFQDQGGWNYFMTSTYNDAGSETCP